MKCGFCNGSISNEDGEQPILEDVGLGERDRGDAYVCPHCRAVISIEKKTQLIPSSPD